MANSGRVIFAAGAVMVAESFHVRPVRAAAAEGDGDHPRHRRTARRCSAVDALADPAAPHGLGRVVAAEVARLALPDVRFGH
jgi:hypothetical protein